MYSIPPIKSNGKTLANNKKDIVEGDDTQWSGGIGIGSGSISTGGRMVEKKLLDQFDSITSLWNDKSVAEQHLSKLVMRLINEIITCLYLLGWFLHL